MPDVITDFATLQRAQRAGSPASTTSRPVGRCLAPAQPRRGPAGQLPAVADRAGPHVPRPAHQGPTWPGAPPKEKPPTKEITRCLKRYVARKVYKALVAKAGTPQ